MKEIAEGVGWVAIALVASAVLGVTLWTIVNGDSLKYRITALESRLAAVEAGK